MITRNRLKWKLPTASGLAVLALGSGVMGPLSLLSRNAPGVPGWSSFTGTTVGDTLLLPILAGCLVASYRYLPGTSSRKEMLALGLGAVSGTAGGIIVQLSWVLDNKPRISWILPRIHHFSPLGYYHAVFLCAVSGLLFSLAFGVAFRAKSLASRGSLELIYQAIRSPVFFMIPTCIWAFSVLIIQGGGSGIGNVATIASVVSPSLLIILLCVYALQTHWTAVLPTMVWALVLASLFCFLIIRWPANLNAPVALIVALGLTGAVTFRAPGSAGRVVESCIIGATAISLIVIPLSDPNDLVRNSLLALCLGPLIVMLTAIGPLTSRPLVVRCSSEGRCNSVSFRDLSPHRSMAIEERTVGRRRGFLYHLVGSPRRGRALGSLVSVRNGEADRK